MGKFQYAEETGECYNCDKKVGAENLVTNSKNCWPVCIDCDWEIGDDDDDWEEE